MTKYARDEFDRVPETSTRQGVHRAVSAPRPRSLAPILAVGFLALAIGLVAFLILPKLGFSSAGESSALSAAPAGHTASAPASPTAGTAPSSPAPSSASPAATPSDSATPQATPKTSASYVDKTQPVAIFNGTTTAGLAGRVGGTVSSAGWVLGQTGNWTGARQSTSVILYSGASQRGNAEALGSLLGIPTLVDSAEITAPLVVVLGPGFQ